MSDVIPGRAARAAAPVLLAVAHGSRDPRHEETMSALAESVRRLLPGRRVELAYLELSAPLLEAALLRLAADRVAEVVAVPLLLTAAYHSRVDLPGRLAKAPLPVRQADVLGPHPLLLDAVVRRLAEAGVAGPDPETSVVLGAAGSSDPDASATVARVAADLAARGWGPVEPAYASAPPPVGEVVAGLRDRGAARVAVASYFLAGGHLPDEVRRAAAGADAVASPLGAADEVARVVVERYRAAGGI